MTKAYCAGLDNFMNGCFMIRALDSSNCQIASDEVSGEETYGAHSRCFEWKEKTRKK